jgi:hypothetical protein
MKYGSVQTSGIIVLNLECINLPDSWSIYTTKFIPVGIDIAKHLMQVHFINEHAGEVID